MISKFRDIKWFQKFSGGVNWFQKNLEVLNDFKNFQD